MISIKVTKDQEMLAEKPKFRDIITNDYIKSFFIDPKKKVMRGTLASDNNRGYMYISKQNDSKNFVLIN